MKNDIIRIGRYRLRSINVQNFTWFHKTYGNPYFAMIVTVNQGLPSEHTFVVPMQYGRPGPYYVMGSVRPKFATLFVPSAHATNPRREPTPSALA